MKKFGLLLLVICVCFVTIGCTKDVEMYDSDGNKVNESDTNENVNDDTKVGTIAESYEKYTTLKSEVYTELTDKMNEDENYNLSLSMGLLGFSSLDLTFIPLTFCGLEDQAAIAGLSYLYKNIDYKSTKDSCKITFTSDEGSMSYDSKYDKGSDSLQTKVYEGDKLIAISEYTKLDSGYATQYYSVDDETVVYKSIFSKGKMIVGIVKDASEPEALYKNASMATEEWTKSDYMWAKYDNGVVNSILEGQEN